MNYKHFPFLISKLSFFRFSRFNSSQQSRSDVFGLKLVEIDFSVGRESLKK
jgi:hypothetical protein